MAFARIAAVEKCPVLVALGPRPTDERRVAVPKR